MRSALTSLRLEESVGVGFSLAKLLEREILGTSGSPNRGRCQIELKRILAILSSTEGNAAGLHSRVTRPMVIPN
jgi:hypothetical protein